MPRMNGIIESSLFVKDLSRACDFYEEVLGLRKVIGSDSNGYLFEAATRQLLLVISEKKARISSSTPGGIVPCLVEPGAALGAGHIAFAIDKSELESWCSHGSYWATPSGPPMVRLPVRDLGVGRVSRGASDPLSEGCRLMWRTATRIAGGR